MSVNIEWIFDTADTKVAKEMTLKGRRDSRLCTITSILVEVVHVVVHFGKSPAEVTREVETEEHEGGGPAKTHGHDGNQTH